MPETATAQLTPRMLFLWTGVKREMPLQSPPPPMLGIATAAAAGRQWKARREMQSREKMLF
jgi:hypothetical protein